MISEFRVKGYRNVSADITLGHCTVLIGPNNSGKSNLLSALRFVVDAAQSKSDTNFDRIIRVHGGLELVNRDYVSSVDWRFEQSLNVEMEWRLRSHLSSTTIAVDLGHGATGPKVVSERFRTEALDVTFEGIATDSNTTLTRNNGDIETREFAPGGSWLLGTVAERASANEVLQLLADELWLMRSTLANTSTVQMSDVSTRQLRSPSIGNQGGERLRPDASNLVPYLRALESDHGAGLTGIVRHMDALLPGLDRLWVREVPGQAAWIETHYDDGKTIPLRQLSDGTISALVLSSVLHTPAKIDLVIIDEPELNLHPAWLKVIAGWLERHESAGQVIFTTHSPELLDALTEGFRDGEVTLLVSSMDGTVKNVDPESLSDLLGEGYDLGDLYRIGEPQLGGWPW